MTRDEAINEAMSIAIGELGWASVEAIESDEAAHGDGWIVLCRHGSNDERWIYVSDSDGPELADEHQIHGRPDMVRTCCGADAEGGDCGCCWCGGWSCGDCRGTRPEVVPAWQWF